MIMFLLFLVILLLLVVLVTKPLRRGPQQEYIRPAEPAEPPVPVEGGPKLLKKRGRWKVV
jgi:hypothetical protein